MGGIMPKNYGYEGSDQYRPISPWKYFWYSVLFLIPIIGWLMLIVFTFSSKNINRRNYARSYWCGLFIAIIVTAALTIAGVLPRIETWPDAIMSIPVISTLTHRSPAVTTRTIDLSDVPDGVSLAFYEAMASYEAFFDEYIEFMNRYKAASNPLSMALDYANYMNAYADTMQKLEEIEDDKLTKKEEAYYTQVMLRINRKLVESM